MNPTFKNRSIDRRKRKGLFLIVQQGGVISLALLTPGNATEHVGHPRRAADVAAQSRPTRGPVYQHRGVGALVQFLEKKIH